MARKTTAGAVRKRLKTAKDKMKEFESVDALLKHMDSHKDTWTPETTYYNNVKRTRNELLAELEILLP